MANVSDKCGDNLQLHRWPVQAAPQIVRSRPAMAQWRELGLVHNGWSFKSICPDSPKVHQSLLERHALHVDFGSVSMLGPPNGSINMSIQRLFHETQLWEYTLCFLHIIQTINDMNLVTYSKPWFIIQGVNFFSWFSIPPATYICTCKSATKTESVDF